METILYFPGDTLHEVNNRVESVDYSVLGFLELASEPCANITKEPFDSTWDTTKPAGYSIPSVLNISASILEETSNAIPNVLKEG